VPKVGIETHTPRERDRILSGDRPPGPPILLALVAFSRSVRHDALCACAALLRLSAVKGARHGQHTKCAMFGPYKQKPSGIFGEAHGRRQLVGFLSARAGTSLIVILPGVQVARRGVAPWTRQPAVGAGGELRVPSCAWVMLLTIARPRPTPAWSVRMRLPAALKRLGSVETSCAVSLSRPVSRR